VTLNLEAADVYCRTLTRRHYENFSVASRFVDAAKRLDLARIYAFCRTTDDLGDESRDGTALARLERWRAEVQALFDGVEPVHPVLFALQETIARRAMPAAPFLDLIAGDELDAYCRLSAAPVGRMVLRVFGVDGRECERLSDDVCIGLQLANHAQDVSRDAAIGRRYLVESDVEAGGTAGAARAMVERARALLASGEELERRVPRPLRLQLALYRTGGLAICDAIAGIGYQTERRRPSVSGSTKVLLVVRAALKSFS
jgi:phytoene/squalene synthetase